MNTNQQVRSANVARIVIDGTEVGLIQNLRPNDDYAPDAASGIGDIHVQEYVPSMARHTLTVSMLALRKTSLYKLGIFPENGDAALKGLVFDIEIFDKVDGTVLRKYMNCTYGNGDIEITKHAIIATSATLYGLDASGTM
jgi:hypothetical protein